MRSKAERTVIACGVLLGCGTVAAGTVAAGTAGGAHAAVRTGTARPGQPTATATVASWQPPVAAPGGGAQVTGMPDNGEVSCAGTTYCAMVGVYGANAAGTDITGYVWDRSGGTWDTPRQVPGLAALNSGGLAAVNGVSCATAGNCAAGGSYTAAQYGPEKAFVVSEVNGVWQTARPVAGLPARNADATGEIDRVSCADPGDCAAAGWYYDGTQTGTFVVNEAGGQWGKALPLPSVSALGGTLIESLSCPSRGNCAAVGDEPFGASTPAFVISEVSGHWGRAMQVPGTSAGNAGLASVSCAAAGDCVAVGTYATAASPDGVAMQVTETNGRWGSAQPVAGGGDLASSVSCPAVGDCTVATKGHLVSEVNGTWRPPVAVPAAYTPDTVSCPAPGYCSATGYYTLGGDNPYEYGIGLIDESAGSWGPWNLLRQTITSSYQPNGVIDPLSCGAPGNCAVHGYFEDQYGSDGEFAVAKSLVPATATALALTETHLVYGREQALRLSVTVRATRGTPAGSVDIMTGQTTLCTVQLTGGRGGCTLAATRLPAGTYQLAAYYGINAGFASSHSGQVALVIAKTATVTRLALAHPAVPYGHERSELITVSVTARNAGIPAGSVAVETGKTVLCTIRLSSVKGSCSPATRRLKPGCYWLTARYGGSEAFSPSRSARALLVIDR